MKNLIKLLFILLIAACSDKPSHRQDQKENVLQSQANRASELEEPKKRELSDPKHRYIFEDSLTIDNGSGGDRHACGSWTEYSGEISTSMKKLIKTIWLKLEARGFSGYNPSVLDESRKLSYYGKSNPSTGCDSSVTSNISKDFHINVVDYFILNQRYPVEYRWTLKDLKYVRTLLGLRFNNKAFTLVRDESNKVEGVLAETFRQETDRNVDYALSNIPLKIDSDIPVTQTQIDEWNDVFVEAFKADPFFKQFFELAALGDGTGSVSLLSARKGSKGLDAISLNVNGVSGSKVDLGLPFYVQLKGSVDHRKSTNLTTGAVAYKLGNTVVGAIQSYANSGAGFGTEGRQLETSVVASHNFGPVFIEGQLGSVSATDVRFKDWAGIRSQVTVGIDTAWVSPFVQVTHRDFGNQTDTATYGGLEIDIAELKADTYSFSTHLLTKMGHHTVYGITGAVEWSGSLTLNSGVSFTTNVSLGTAAEPSAGLNFSLDR